MSNENSWASERWEAVRAELAPDLEIIRRIGGGRMADVYLARQLPLDRPVAVKILSTQISDDPAAKARFEREARAAGTLDTPYAVEVYRFGYLSDGLPFLVMQYMRGGTLEDRVDAEGPLSQADARRILGDVSEALAAAHARGFVHRDVRAANILCDAEGHRALLSDFGLAGLRPEYQTADARITRMGEIIGTPGYLSPEQLNGEPATEATDVFSLGLLGYKILADQGPFAAKTQREAVARCLKQPPTPLAVLRPDIEAQLANLLERCLAKDPEKRPTASFLAKAFRGEIPASLEERGSATEDGEKDILDALLNRRLPQIVVVTTGVLFAGLAFFDILVDRGVLDRWAFLLALNTFVCGVAASGVLAWFHGARGRQKVQPLEIILLALLGLAWTAAAALIVLA